MLRKFQIHKLIWLSGVLLALLFFLVTPARAKPPPPPKILKVGYVQHPPFVIEKKGSLLGMAVEIWELIAKESGWKYTYEPTTYTVDSGFQALEEKKIDVLIGAIPVEKQGLEKVSFSRAYFVNRVGLLAFSETQSFWHYFDFLVDKILNVKFTLILLVFLLFCHILWWSERGESLPKSYFKGIGHALWLGFTSFVINDSATTKKIRTRLILALWFLLSVTTLATLTASITSALTMTMFSHSKTVSMVNYSDQSVAVVKGTVDAAWVQRLHVKPVYTDTLSSAIQLLNEKKVAAIIGDLPSMQYYLYQHPTKLLKVSKEILGYDEYAFAFKKNSPLLTPFDLKLKELKETPKLKELCVSYVGPHGALLCDI